MNFSLIVPTYNEKENIQKLLKLLKDNLDRTPLLYEIIVVDDNSPDGTGEILDNLKKEYTNLKIIHRQGKLGLSSAVLDGFNASEGDILGVMDADLSHPVEKIYEMYKMSLQGADLIIGSRYIKGGRIEGWGFFRKILSKGATILARLFVDVVDPMSGFFILRKDILKEKILNPQGFKILLEILIKTNCKNVVEVPIIFTNRTLGKSKAGTKEIVYYLKNLMKYLPYKKNLFFEFLKFSFVGFLGTILNVSILYVLTEHFRVYYLISSILAFIVAVTLNFVLNKVWTFQEEIHEKTFIKYKNFILVSISALAVNLFFLYILTEFFKIYYLISQVLSIGLSMVINFIGNKIWTFGK